MQRQGLRHPARLIPLTFFGVIVLGTLLLMLPMSAQDSVSAPWLTALFTATSAVCVTGLIVVDTPVYWSTFGQVVILGLIQVGGFGIMTGATLLGLLVSRRLRLGTTLIAQAETRSLGLGEVASVLKLILVATVAIELLVAAVLTLRLHFAYGEAWGTAAWNGLFHAVAAYTNSGFSTYSIGLMGFATDALVLAPLMLGIVLGGLGFPVLQEIRREGVGWRGWSVHTKLTLIGTGGLLVGGTLALLMSEWNATLAPLAAADKLLVALFQSVCARTAGFNAVDIGAMSTESLSIHYVLMFIGGGSASTAGGVKITTFLLLGCAVLAEIRGSGDTTAFGRRIASETLRQALTVVLLGLTAVAVATLALLAMTDFGLDALLFEAISAFATVGLSTGITDDLPPAGQLVLIGLMFVGRVGTITVATALALRQRTTPFRYPEEHPIVG